MTCLTNDNAVVERVETSELGVKDVVSVRYLAESVLRASCFSKLSDSRTAACAAVLLPSQRQLLR